LTQLWWRNKSGILIKTRILNSLVACLLKSMYFPRSSLFMLFRS
jgi:hypothetical protein